MSIPNSFPFNKNDLQERNIIIALYVQALPRMLVGESGGGGGVDGSACSSNAECGPVITYNFGYSREPSDILLPLLCSV